MKKAIMCSCNDAYSFCAANLLLSIKDNSRKVFDECDFIICNHGICEKNQKALLKIKDNIIFHPVTNNFPEILYSKATDWGIFALELLRPLEMLTKGYNRILFMDTDMYVNKPLDYLFEAEFDIAFRPVNMWHASELFARYNLLKNPTDNPPAPNGGLIVFNDSINKFNISLQALEERAVELKDLDANLKSFSILGSTPLSIGEIIISYLTYYYNLNTLILPDEWNCWITHKHIASCIVQHFYSQPFKIDSKPWTNPAVFRAFPKWAENYYKFIELGGCNFPIIQDDNSFFNAHYTLFVLNSFQKYIQVVKKLNILKDPVIDFDFDFFRYQLRFHFKQLFNVLFIDFFYHKNKCEVSLVMRGILLSPQNIAHLEPLYKLVTEKFDKVSYVINNNQHMIIIQYQNINVTNYIIDVLAALTKVNLYNYLVRPN